MSHDAETPPTPRKSSPWRGPAIAGCTLLALWLAFEALCRVVDLPALSLAELDPLSSARERLIVGPHPYLGYSNKPGYVHEATDAQRYSINHNSLGFRGRETSWEKPAGVWRVLCMGGSSTYGLGPTSDETNWPARLEAHLNDAAPAKRVEVINAGCQGWSTFESFINLGIRGVDFQPDLVVVYQMFNDMRCALYPGVQRDNTHWRAVWPVERRGALDRVLERSRLFLTWRRYGTDWWESQKNLSAWAIVDMGRFKDNFAQPTDPQLGLANYQRNLIDIIGLAHAHGAEVLLATECMRVSDFDLFSSGPLQREWYQRFSDVVGEAANERSVPFCDARAVLEPEAERQRAERGQDTLFTREVHLTDEGCDLLGRTLAARILELGLVK